MDKNGKMFVQLVSETPSKEKQKKNNSNNNNKTQPYHLIYLIQFSVLWEKIPSRIPPSPPQPIPRSSKNNKKLYTRNNKIKNNRRKIEFKNKRKSEKKKQRKEKFLPRKTKERKDEKIGKILFKQRENIMLRALVQYGI